MPTRFSAQGCICQFDLRNASVVMPWIFTSRTKQSSSTGVLFGPLFFQFTFYFLLVAGSGSRILLVVAF
jgi:hypothetical protein